MSVLDLDTPIGWLLLANVVHVCLGALAILITVLFGGQHAQWYAVAGVLVFAAVKEFWWDIHYETPVTSGGYKGGFTDFMGYVTGLAVALGLVALKYALA